MVAKVQPFGADSGQSIVAGNIGLCDPDSEVMNYLNITILKIKYIISNLVLSTLN